MPTLGWVRLSTPQSRVCVLQRAEKNCFWAGSLSPMINENIVSLLFGPQTKDKRGNTCALSKVKISRGCSIAYRPRVGMPCSVPESAFLLDPTSDLTSFLICVPCPQPHPMGLAHFSSLQLCPLVRNTPHYSQQS